MLFVLEKTERFEDSVMEGREDVREIAVLEVQPKFLQRILDLATRIVPGIQEIIRTLIGGIFTDNGRMMQGEG